MRASEQKKIDGGRVWFRKRSGMPGWTDDPSNDGMDILEDEKRGGCVLVSFRHDPLPGDDCEFWRKRFATVEEAMEYAEKM